MPERAIPLRPTLDQRIESIDALRGIAILLMLFVNDIAGVNGVPDWMKHTPRGMDGLTFTSSLSCLFVYRGDVPSVCHQAAA